MAHQITIPSSDPSNDGAPQHHLVACTICGALLLKGDTMTNSADTTGQHATWHATQPPSAQI